MKEKLSRLYEYLVNNDHMQDASEIDAFINEFVQNGSLSDFSKKKLSAMCSPGYLGNLYIKGFSDPYMWWNFLDEIRKEIT